MDPRPEPGSPEAAELLALIEEERARAARALEPDAAVIYALWGVAWLLGFLAMWAGYSAAIAFPRLVGGLVFAALIGTAVIVNVVHVIRRTAGLRGASQRSGAMYGWSWTLGFVALSLVMAGVMRSGLPVETLSLLWAVLPGLVVGVLYLAGGALWQDRTQYALGCWVLASCAAGSLAGYPGVYLAMAFGGGGGFLLAALLLALRRRAGR